MGDTFLTIINGEQRKDEFIILQPTTTDGVSPHPYPLLPKFYEHGVLELVPVSLLKVFLNAFMLLQSFGI